MKKVSHDKINEARELLELGETATIREIRAAYKQLARSRHPDPGGTDAEMKRINEARALLLGIVRSFPYRIAGKTPVARTMNTINGSNGFLGTSSYRIAL